MADGLLPGDDEPLLSRSNTDDLTVKWSDYQKALSRIQFLEDKIALVKMNIEEILKNGK